MVDIEAAILPGLPSFEIVGLGDSAVRESRNRVHAAIKNSNFDFPASRITASYAPAWLRKEGSAFDLPLALAILIASGQIPSADPSLCIFGELSLTGEVRRVPGAICRVATCRENHMQRIMVPIGNAAEALSAGGDGLLPVTHLREAADLLKGVQTAVPRASHSAPQAYSTLSFSADNHPQRDISSIIGQEKAVRALQIAAAGRHNLLLMGSPGCGKTSLASMLPDLLPPFEPEDALQVTRIFSAAGLLGDSDGLMTRRPFRTPHHSITRSAMIGGGSIPSPGEVSLAHHGVLFLDEMTEFQPDTLDLLRQPMEDQSVRLVRLRHSISYPADFILVGAANPCRCGEYFEPNDRCRCTDDSVRQHLNRLSGPLLDRIDLTVEMTRLPASDLPLCVRRQNSARKSTVELSADISHSWQIQKQRCHRQGIPVTANGRMHGQDLLKSLDISPRVADYAASAATGLNLSVRGYQRILRLARTIADLEAASEVTFAHVAEAMQFRIRMP